MASIGSFEVAARRAEGVEPDTFDFCGETFTVSDQIGIIPLGRFAKAATSGLDSSEMEGMAAMIDLLGDAVIDADRERFLNTAAKNHASADDLMPIVQAVVQAQTARPTQRSSDSSAGPSTTGTSSKDSSPFGPVPPIQSDPRVQALVPVESAALSLVG